MDIGWFIGARNADRTPVRDEYGFGVEDRRVNTIFSWYGWRGRVGGQYHSGFDIVRPTGMGSINGDPVLAVVGGSVAFAGYTTWGGNTVAIKSTLVDPATGQYLIFTYMHLLAPARAVIDGVDRPLRERDHVSQGQVVGFVGNTGISDGPHLHFEVSNSGLVLGGSSREDRIPFRVNPRFFFPAGDDVFSYYFGHHYYRIGAWYEQGPTNTPHPQR